MFWRLTYTHKNSIENIAIQLMSWCSEHLNVVKLLCYCLLVHPAVLLYHRRQDTYCMYFLLNQVEKITSQTALCPSSNLYMCLYHKATVTVNAVASTVVESDAASDHTSTSTYNLRHNPVKVDCCNISVSVSEMTWVMCSVGRKNVVNQSLPK